MGWSDDVLEGKEISLWGGDLRKYNATLNIKAFYNELHDFLNDKGFTDKYFVEKKLKQGEFPNNDNFTRTNDYYETKFTVIDKGDGVKELEIVWESQLRGMPHTGDMGEVFFKLDMSVRNWKKEEILDGTNKITLDSGGWEMRNRFSYKNHIVADKLDKMPFLKDREWLKRLWLENVYMSKVKADLEKHVLVRLTVGIQKIIDKHFVSGSK